MDGWVKLWRQLTESDVWDLPPLSNKVWVWLLLRVNRAPSIWCGTTIERGETITSYNHIAYAIAWTENRKKVIPSVSEVRWAVKSLQKLGVLVAQPRQGALHIKVLHWDQYQGNGDGHYNTMEAGTTTEPRQDHDTHTRKKKKEERIDTVSGFDSFWSIYPRRESKAKSILAFKKAAESVGVDTIMAGLNLQVEKLRDAHTRGYCPLATTWLNGRRWEDEVGPPEMTDLEWELYKNRQEQQYGPRRMR